MNDRTQKPYGEDAPEKEIARLIEIAEDLVEGDSRAKTAAAFIAERLRTEGRKAADRHAVEHLREWARHAETEAAGCKFGEDRESAMYLTEAYSMRKAADAIERGDHEGSGEP